MPKLRRNQKLTCIRCGRVVTVSAAGVSRGTIWCCSRPMQQKIKAAPKKAAKRKRTKKKTPKKRVVKRRTVKRKGVRKKAARRTTARRKRR
ncbi:MAG: hypothetical protein AMJ46_12245 [Latescibacteria bacterium DG_63]|nr:MAG: hypothetical protein AMJ46_12245 [Latescibacteria bacterium DG_63]